jgi:hypothetical protein
MDTEAKRVRPRGTKVFANDKFEIPMKVSEDGVNIVEIENYAGILLMAINSPPQGGFTPASNADATELYNKINPLKDDSEIEFTLAEFNKVKQAWGNLRLFKRSTDVSNVEAYINSL